MCIRTTLPNRRPATPHALLDAPALCCSREQGAGRSGMIGDVEREEGFEPSTSSLEGTRSAQLSYSRVRSTYQLAVSRFGSGVSLGGNCRLRTPGSVQVGTAPGAFDFDERGDAEAPTFWFDSVRPLSDAFQVLVGHEVGRFEDPLAQVGSL